MGEIYKYKYQNFVILCGGSGSRLWPTSREKLPKQFFKLTNNYTMLQNTIFRINKVIEILANTNKDNHNHMLNRIIIICNIDHYFIVENQINELNIKEPLNILIITEPKGRDSAPAVCISSLISDPDEITFIMPCDHIFDDNEFGLCSKIAFEHLKNNESIVTFGIKPNRIETGYGYIKYGENNKTIQFVEKPNYQCAKKYFESGNYLWNAGIFIFRNKTMISAFQKYSYDILESCRLTLEKSDLSKNIINLSKKQFINCRAISIDYAIIEHLVNDTNSNIGALTIPYNSNWNDIGSFSSLYDECQKDENNNVIIGNVLALNCNNSYVNSEQGFTSIIGLDNMLIVNTRDSLLVCNKDNSQDVKKVVTYLKENNKEEAFFHAKVFRPWGYYINVEGNNYSGFKIKRIAVYPGKRLSLQSHNHRSEHWVIVSGRAQVQVNSEIFYLNADDHVYIPIKALHRIENIGHDLMEFTETQIGKYLGEDDIVRYEDDFGRVQQ
jgi:mannose-1-phosphate guanylyltransferase